jgi:hypothetical protein
MGANTYYLGQTPEEYFNKTEKYFYGVKRDSEGFLVVTKVNLDTSPDSIDIVNMSTMGALDQTFDMLEEGVDFFEGIDTDRTNNYQGLNFEQYKWSADDLYYYVDGEGRLCVRVNIPYNYSEGVVNRVLAETILIGSAVDLGTIAGYKPLENTTVIDFGLISDNEATIIPLTMGTIV